jgi:hypothetical protein
MSLEFRPGHVHVPVPVSPTRTSAPASRSESEAKRDAVAIDATSGVVATEVRGDATGASLEAAHTRAVQATYTGKKGAVGGNPATRGAIPGVVRVACFRGRNVAVDQCVIGAGLGVDSRARVGCIAHIVHAEDGGTGTEERSAKGRRTRSPLSARAHPNQPANARSTIASPSTAPSSTSTPSPGATSRLKSEARSRSRTNDDCSREGLRARFFRIDVAAGRIPHRAGARTGGGEWNFRFGWSLGRASVPCS